MGFKLLQQTNTTIGSSFSSSLLPKPSHPKTKAVGVMGSKDEQIRKMPVL